MVVHKLYGVILLRFMLPMASTNICIWNVRTRIRFPLTLLLVVRRYRFTHSWTMKRTRRWRSGLKSLPKRVWSLVKFNCSTSGATKKTLLLPLLLWPLQHQRMLSPTLRTLRPHRLFRLPRMATPGLRSLLQPNLVAHLLLHMTPDFPPPHSPMHQFWPTGLAPLLVAVRVFSST